MNEVTSDRATDAAIADWLARPLPAMAAVDVAAITLLRQAPGALPVLPALPRRIAGWRPALMAASVMAVLATAGWLAMPPKTGSPAGAPPQMTLASAQPQPAGAAAAAEADLAFAYVFTPTAAEEELI